jgi:DNA-binding transcriptional regulator YiaG
MYHYTESGLRNVWLVNGYRYHKTAYGPAISIAAVDALHDAIGRWLAAKPGRLTGSEFRFLRLELELSQRALGDYLGAAEQAVARWERGVTKVPRWADRFLRALWREHVDGNVKIRELVERLNAADERRGAAKLELRLRGGAWRAAA